MKYYVQFQPLPKGAARPIDDGCVADFECDEKGFAMLPNVGDFFNAIDKTGDRPHAKFHGRVKSRLFSYFDNEACFINIVVEETDDDWGLLIKE